MKHHTLYLMVGYPGAGKTTIAQLIADQMGAKHVWADLERHKLFDQPTHKQTESKKLYEKLNRRVEKFLGAGKSVVFDTSFNHRRDRDLLRKIAAKHHARTLVVWLATPTDVARDRAVHSRVVRNGYGFHMTAKQFDRIAGRLEPPGEDEEVIKLDGIKFDPTSVKRLFDG